MAAPTAAPSMTFTPGTTAPTAAPPTAPTAAPSAMSPLLRVAQALSETELARTTANSCFCIVFLPIVDLPDHAPRTTDPPARVHVTREETTLSPHRSGHATMRLRGIGPPQWLGVPLFSLR